jgi:predicted lipid-binding transport protein (Tim44 family)
MDVIILLICAFIIINRLVKMLGQFDPESDRERQEKYNKSVVATLFKQKYEGNKSQNINVINPEIVSAAELKLPESILKVLQQIRTQDPEFDFDRFINGAKKAYIMITKAISDSDHKTLEYLLDSDMYEKMIQNIEQSNLTGSTNHTSISEIESIDIVDAALYGDRAMLTINIKSKQISFSEDSKGNLVSGSKEKAVNKIKTVVFSRYLTQENVWKISKMS